MCLSNNIRNLVLVEIKHILTLVLVEIKCEYNPKKLYIINKSQKDKIQVGKTIIEFLPYYTLFDEKLI